MNIWRNPEWRKESVCLGAAGLLLSLAGLLISVNAALYGLAVSVCLNLIYAFITYRRYRDIRGMSQEIDRILHGEEYLELGNYREGDLSVLRDEVYKMTVRLREQAEHLREEKNFLADTLADISHQIRTPLTSLNLMVSRLRQPNLGQEARMELLINMKQLLSQVEWLVESLLKMSKLDADSVPFSREYIPMDEFLRQALRSLEIPMELKEQTLELEVEDGCGFAGDYAWTMEAVMNVLKNCMEYTPVGGKIYVRAKETPIFTELVIQDSGPGIAKDDMPHLFERFYRGRQAGKNSFGIGLALSRAILGKEDGVIKAENVGEECGIEGKGNGISGSRFIIRFYKKM